MRKLIIAMLMLAVAACGDTKARMDGLLGASEADLITSMNAVPSSSYTMDDGTKLLRWDFHRREYDGDMSECTIEWTVRGGVAQSYRARGNHCY